MRTLRNREENYTHWARLGVGGEGMGGTEGVRWEEGKG